MPAILTDKYRTFLAQQFKTAVENGDCKAYVFIGRPEEWDVDSAPPTPDSTFQNLDYEYYRDMFAARRIASDNVAFVVTRSDWTANTIYDQYDDTVELAGSNYFVLDTSTLPYKVYKCVWNNLGAPSTTAPSDIGTALNPTGTADGYVWQYMYTVTTDYYKFLTTNWMPVLSNSSVIANALTYAGRLPTAVPLVIEDPGANYSALAVTTASLAGDGANATVANSGVTITGGEVSGVVLNSGGLGYTQVTSINVYQSGATAATVRAIIPPYPNHGYDPVKELSASAIILTTQFLLSETGNVTVNNNFRRVGLITNPLSVGDVALDTDVLRLTTDIILSANTGVFAPDDVITNTTNAANPTAIVVDVILNDDTKYVVRTVAVNAAGATTPFANGDTITCVTSGVEGTVESVVASDMKPYSGQIVFVNQRTPVTRASDQSEEIKLVFPFR